MTKNNSMNWKDIEKEFRKKWTDVMQWSDDYGDREAYGSSAQQILAFFKPYFQELEEKAWMYDQLCK